MSVSVTNHAWVKDWPFLRPGVCLVYVGTHFLMLLDDGVTSDGFDDYMNEIDRVTAAAPDDFSGASIFHMRESAWWSSLSIGEKTARLKRFGDFSAKHAQKLRKNVPISVTVAVSAMTRAVLRTMNALSPAAVPRSVAATAEEAWIAVRRAFPTLDVAAHLDVHERLVAARAPGLAGSLRRRQR
jgi:hypothetical protein